MFNINSNLNCIALPSENKCLYILNNQSLICLILKMLLKDLLYKCSGITGKHSIAALCNAQIT